MTADALTATTRITPQQLDRARATLIGHATGDALGAPHEFKAPYEGPLHMTGGGGFGWAPGEWTDDTTMLVGIARAAAAGGDLVADSSLEVAVAEWLRWYQGRPKDIGGRTSQVLSRVASAAASRQPDASARRYLASAAFRAALDAARPGEGGKIGNGALMRTAPVGLLYLTRENDPAKTAATYLAGEAQSNLTHRSLESGQACGLWSAGIREAVLTGERPDMHLLIDRTQDDPSAALAWHERVAEAELKWPSHFTRNGSVVPAFQAAWSAVLRGDDAAQIIDSAVRCGFDTDTVGAIAGGMAGAIHGTSSLPAEWTEVLHGWPYKAEGGRRFGLLDLIRLADEIVAVDPATR